MVKPVQKPLVVTSHPVPESKGEVTYRCLVLPMAWRDLVQREQVQGTDEGFDLTVAITEDFYLVHIAGFAKWRQRCSVVCSVGWF